MNRKHQYLLGLLACISLLFGCNRELHAATVPAYLFTSKQALCKQSIARAKHSIKKTRLSYAVSVRDHFTLHFLVNNLQHAEKSQQEGNYDDCIAYSEEVYGCVQQTIQYMKWQHGVKP